MAVRRQKFPFPVQPTKPSTIRLSLGPRFQGMNTSVPPQSLRPGETPYSENFVINDGVLESRSGVSSYPATTVDSWETTVQQNFRAYMRGYQADGSRFDFLLASGITDVLGAYSDDTGATWTNDSSTLSEIFPTNSVGNGPMEWTQFYNPDDSENAIAFTSNYTLPIYRTITASSNWTPISTLTSHESTAKFIASFDDRLILFNTTTAAGNHGNRVRFSVRGDPLDFTSIGAGLEDLTDMRGAGSGMAVEEDKLVLFTDYEVWEAMPRRDAYAFDFRIVEKDAVGPLPNTLVRTPSGIIWLGKDYNFYLYTGGTVRQFEPDVKEYLRLTLTENEWDSLNAQYDEREGLYMLFFERNIDRDGIFRPYAFFMRVRDIRPSRDGTKVKGDWMLQNLVGCGGYPTVVRGYDNALPVPSNNYLLPILFHLDQDWNYDVNLSPEGMVQLWTSPALRGTKDATQYESVSDLMVDYSYAAASSASTLRMRFVERASHSTGWNFTSVKSTDFSGTPDVIMPNMAFSAVTDGRAYFPTSKSAHIAMTPEASRYHQFMMYNPGNLSNQTLLDAGKSNPEAKLTIHNIHVTLRTWSGRRPF